jgi:hypothetical protein
METFLGMHTIVEIFNKHCSLMRSGSSNSLAGEFEKISINKIMDKIRHSRPIPLAVDLLCNKLRRLVQNRFDDRLTAE